jgi:hypothetical protein
MGTTSLALSLLYYIFSKKKLLLEGGNTNEQG